MIRSLLAAGALLAAGPGAPATPTRSLAPRPLVPAFAFTPESVVTYTVVHKLHHVTGTSHQINGLVTATPEGVAVPFALTVPLASFTSGNDNRDANALLALDAPRTPAARLAVASIDYAWKTFKPGQVGGRLDFKGVAHGTLTLRGVSQPLSFPIEGWTMPVDAHVTAHFAVSLAEFGIPAPQLLFISVDDRVEIDVVGVAARIVQ